MLDKDTYSDELNNSVNAAISVEDNNVSKSKTALSDNDVIAKDINGKEYYASDLVGKQIILEYYDKEDDKKRLFFKVHIMKIIIGRVSALPIHTI